MARDYKHVSEPKIDNHASSDSDGSGGKGALPGWFWLFSGLVIGAFITALVLLKLNVKVEDDPSSSGKVENNTPKTSNETKIEKTPEEKSRFEFYSILPDREITVQEQKNKIEEKIVIKEQKPTAEIKAIEKPKPILKNKSSRYTLQAGSFSNFKDADKRKANLALLGVTSKIYSVRIDDRKSMYRVQIGPYSSIEKINDLSALLKENNIPSFLVKIKG